MRNFIVIKGKVTTDDMHPIDFANVINLKEKTGTQTDKNGEYELIIKKPTTITISHIGFQTHQINIFQNMFIDSLSSSDTLTINIILKITINELNAVEITDENIKLVYDKPNVDILDYGFNNNNIVLLVEENRTYKLRLMNPDADSIIKNKTLDFNAENLYIDCFGNMHILSKDSSYQVYIVSSEIYIYKGIPIKQFNSFLLPCVASTSEYLFFQQWGSHNQSVVYSTINKLTKNKKLLMSIKNAESDNFANGEIKRINELKKRNMNDMGDLSTSNLKIAREIKNRTWFYEAILTKQIYNPLKTIRDSVFIFNHTTDTAYVYNNSGELKRTFNIKYHYENGWDNEIIIDITTQLAYAKFISNGIVYLYLINLNNGNILNQYKLEQHTFPNKIKLKENYAYYIDTDSKAEIPHKKIFKQRLN